MAENKWTNAGIGMAAGAANGALGQVFGMIAGKAQDRRQIKQAEKLQELQMKGQKDMGMFNKDMAMQMWKDTNAQAQIEQYKKAGLNAGLMYGGGGAGGATASTPPGSVSGQSAEGPSAGVGMGIQMASMLALQKAQKENIEADTENKKQGTNLTTEDIEKRKMDTLTQGEEYTKKAAESQEANRGLEDRLTRIKAEATGAEIENEAKKVGITVDREKIKQMAAQVAQGWKQLDQGEQRLRIETFRVEMEKAYPGLMNVAGRTINDTIQALFDMGGSDRNKQMQKVK